MIASLHGDVIAIGLDHGVIECGGVGYLFYATPATLGALRRGDNATILTHMVVKEDALTLYGFADSQSREIFTILQTVKGLGPRLALAALAALSPADIARAVTTNDPKKLQVINGVGKRVAERMVLELKDKLDSFVDANDNQPGTPGVVGRVESSNGAEVVAALTSLGFDEAQATVAVAAVTNDHPEMPTSQLLKQALKQLGR